MRNQEVANSALFIMTTWNVILGTFMVAELISVTYGMCLAFGGSIGIVVCAWRTLMGDERPWESPKMYRTRTQKESKHE
jgi:hypothetical protein